MRAQPGCAGATRRGISNRMLDTAVAFMNAKSTS